MISGPGGEMAGGWGAGSSVPAAFGKREPSVGILGTDGPIAEELDAGESGVGGLGVDGLAAAAGRGRGGAALGAAAFAAAGAAEPDEGTEPDEGSETAALAGARSGTGFATALASPP